VYCAKVKQGETNARANAASVFIADLISFSSPVFFVPKHELPMTLRLARAGKGWVEAELIFRKQ
jgi:hypothetical protein